MMHMILPFIISLLGFYTGVYLVIRTYKLLEEDRTLKVFLYILGIMNIYIGIVYALISIGVVSAIPVTQASILMRPVNLLALVTPFMIAKRMGL